MAAGMRSFVLGISGGIDSTTAGRLAQLAVERARGMNFPATFIAMRLPYGKQRDEDDAQSALNFIQADRIITVDVQPAAAAMLLAMLKGNIVFRDASHQDFMLGNIKARQRMIAQYGVAGAEAGLVIGTDHAAEAVMGFFTKFGDGACDVAPLTGLTKRRVREIGATLGVPDALVKKVPTADLENFRPQHPDEDSYGLSYDDIDDFLEGKAVTDYVHDLIVQFYKATAHKRALPVAPQSSYPSEKYSQL
jgi:NAD+ synthase